MSLSASEGRALTRIERGLLARDPRLSSLFTTFTQLTWREAMPAWEQLRRRRWRPAPGIMIAIALALALAVAMVVVGAIVASPRACAPGRLGPAVAKTLAPGCPAGTSANPLR
jgi:Protein of unknown function (DUF3040)